MVFPVEYNDFSSESDFFDPSEDTYLNDPTRQEILAMEHERLLSNEELDALAEQEKERERLDEEWIMRNESRDFFANFNDEDDQEEN